MIRTLRCGNSLAQKFCTIAPEREDFDLRPAEIDADAHVLLGFRSGQLAAGEMNEARIQRFGFAKRCEHRLMPEQEIEHSRKELRIAGARPHIRGLEAANIDEPVEILRRPGEERQRLQAKSFS